MEKLFGEATFVTMIGSSPQKVKTLLQGYPGTPKRSTYALEAKNCF